MLKGAAYDDGVCLGAAPRRFPWEDFMDSPVGPAARVFLLLVLLLPVAAAAHADPTLDWVVRYPNLSKVTNMAIDVHDCTYVTGYASGNGWDFATVKYSPGGRQLDSAHYVGPGRGDDVPFGITLDRSGNVYVCGTSAQSSQDNQDFIIIKYDSTLVQQWVRIYTGQGNFGYDAAYAVTTDSLGYVYACGESFEPATDADMVTLKYDASGNLLWAQRYNGAGNLGDEAEAIAVDRAGSVYVTGETQRTPTGGNMDFTTIKYDSNGVRQWVQIYNGPADGNDGGVALALDAQGNVCVTGQSTGIGTRYDATTIKYSPQGVQLWLRTYDGNHGNDAGKALTLDSAGNIYVTGIADPTIDYLTIKYDANGDQEWVETYHGPGAGASESQSVAVDLAGNVYVTGYSDGSPNQVVNYDYATIKYDSTGVQQWVERYNGTGNNIDVAVKVGLDSRNNLIVTGWSTGTAVNFTTIKYDQEAPSAIPAPPAFPGLRAELSPVPTSGDAVLRFHLSEASAVRLTLVDPAGRMARELSPGPCGPGEHEAVVRGEGLAPGVYFYRLQAGKQVAEGKLVRE